jgi:hypothetical protein
MKLNTNKGLADLKKRTNDDKAKKPEPKKDGKK